MNSRFVFRLDGSKENDAFFLTRCIKVDVLRYSGLAMSVGPGWIPDLVEVDAVDGGSQLVLTLVELEAMEIVALASCRKYLPESSTDIVHRFVAYLDSVIAQCRVTSDPRLESIGELRGAFDKRPRVLVRSAGALRSGSDFLELHSLLDHAERVSIRTATPATATPEFQFAGIRSLSREETDGLRRTVRVLHAVVTGHDHSNGTVHSWRNLRRKPLDIAVAKDRRRFAHLDQLLGNKAAAGIRIDCGRVIAELADLWSTSSVSHLSPSDICDAVRRFVPVSMRFDNQQSMRAVYEAARSLLKENAA
jgi:hypothetical protein